MTLAQGNKMPVRHTSFPTPSQIAIAVMTLLQIITLWWVTDQTTRLRAQELSLGELKASLLAVQPFAALDRVTLTQITTVVSKQDVTLDQTILLMREMNNVVHALTKSHTELRSSIERIEQQVAFQAIKRR